MIPSEELELRLYRFAEFAGRARWQPADLGALVTSCQFIEQAVLVQAIDDLHTRKFMEFRRWKYAQNDWVLYAGQDREYFSYPFEMRVTFPGRKYFEGLEAQSARPLQPADGREIWLQGTSDGMSTATARLDSSPQAIAEPPPPPKAFVSHSSQDRQFVQKFVADLCDFGVRAWYSRWEIMAGDSIPQRIEEGIEDCEFFIIVLSRNSIHAPWVQTELQAAIARKMNGKIRKIIPIKIDDCGDLPPIIDTLHRVNFMNRPYEAAVKDVLDSILDVDLRRPLAGVYCESIR